MLKNEWSKNKNYNEGKIAFFLSFSSFLPELLEFGTFVSFHFYDCNSIYNEFKYFYEYVIHVLHNRAKVYQINKPLNNKYQ